MFERRLKIFLVFLTCFALMLACRAGQVQIFERDQWRKAAAESIRRPTFVDTVRGNIFDCRNRLIATDQPCTDACVDFRALTDIPDEEWVKQRALERLHTRLADQYSATNKKLRQQMLEVEAAGVRSDIREMWGALAKLSGRSPEQIGETRSAIVHRVQMRRRIIWYNNYRKSREKAQSHPLTPEAESIWKRWLIEEDAPAGADIDNFAVTVAEQSEAHVVLRAIPTELQNQLGKHIDRYPGLVLRPSTHRFYPYRSAFCHGMGHVAHVSHEDLVNDINTDDELRKYMPNDLIGREGAEGLCEPALRGAKGRVVKVLGNDTPVENTPAVYGEDVHLTIDIELQSEVEQIFSHADVIDKDGNHETAMLHGAAVIIDVPTGEVRALASYPTYDLNRFDDDYDELHNDQMNNPLFNRATQSQLQPGSTIKPVVGVSAITQGISTADEGIECTGFLVIDGKRLPFGRCWVASKFSKILNGQVAHHPVPSNAPHPTGFLTFADALERSCNVYFETIANRLGMEGISVWYDRFGLGRPTGIGIAEAKGRLPRDFSGPAWDRKWKTCFSGIGQDPVAATPIQMANAITTIARDGIWMRPRLISDADGTALGISPSILRNGPGPGGQSKIPDRVDLNLSRAALAAAHLGMHNVVAGLAGTGTAIRRGASPELLAVPLCCKTGTAQAPRFFVIIKDEHGKPVRDERGRPRKNFIDPGTPGHPNPIAPWYRATDEEGKDINHAWYVGFAPEDHPQVAFAVMVEYGGSGGVAAAAVARQALEACIHHGYLKSPAGREAEATEAP